MKHCLLLLLLLWLPTPVSSSSGKKVSFTLTLLLSRGSSLLLPSLPPRPRLNGLARLPQGKPRGAEHPVAASGSAPSPETTWIAPRLTGGRWSRGGARVPGSDWSEQGKHPDAWGGAGSGSGRRQLKRFWRFGTWSRCLQVPWARLRRAKGTRDAAGTWGWAMAGARGAAAAASAGSSTSSGTSPPQEPGLGELLEEFSRTQYRAKDCSGTGGSRVSS